MAAKKSPKKSPAKKKSSSRLKAGAKRVIGIDLGGTKVLAAMVNEKGQILEEMKVPTELVGGFAGLKTQLIALCRELIARHGKVEAIGIGSAGPLHAPSGMLLDPTNFGWPTAKVNIAAELKRALKVPVRLENDAAAAILAEHWKGGAGKDSIVVTLGTGLGVGIMIEGKLLRGSRGLHPEAGHILLRPNDHSVRCGCGNYGCSEAYLSGNHFGARAAIRLKMPGITAKQVSEMARNGNPAAKALFDEYAEMLGEYLQNLVVLFYPKTFVLTGSFADAHPHFLEGAKGKLRQLLERRLLTLPLMPEVRVSKLGNRAGSLGAAYVAFHDSYAAPDPA